MSTKSPRHLWQKRWTFDDGVAVHESGLIVGPSGVTGAEAVRDALARGHGGNAPAMLRRLIDEGRAVLEAGGTFRARLKGDPVR